MTAPDTRIKAYNPTDSTYCIFTPTVANIIDGVLTVSGVTSVSPTTGNQYQIMAAYEFDEGFVVISKTKI